MTKFVPFEIGLDYTVRTLGFDDVNRQMDWCDERFNGIYTNTYMPGSGTNLWLFKNRKEAIWFALTWT